MNKKKDIPISETFQKKCIDCCVGYDLVVDWRNAVKEEFFLM